MGARRETTPAGPLASGATAPSFTLRDQHGRLVRTKRLLHYGPLVLVFVRGLWCERSRADLACLDAAVPTLEAAGASVAAILRYTEEAALHSDVLSTRVRLLDDGTARVARAFGLQSLGRTEPAPARFVVAFDGSIAFSDVYPDYVDRPDPLELLPVIRARIAAAGRFRRPS